MNISHVETDCSVCGRNLALTDVPVPAAELLLDKFHEQHQHSAKELKVYYREERIGILDEMTEDDDDD